MKLRDQATGHRVIPGFQDQALADALQEKIDQKTKPPGALGRLEEVARRVGLIQGTAEPVIRRPAMVVFAADHGISSAGVSPYPAEVTAQMVANFLGGGAAINVFCRGNGMQLKVVNSGVKSPVPAGDHPDYIDLSMGAGTASFLEGPAMSEEQLLLALERGAGVVAGLEEQGCNTIGFGEMGIGNTSAAALLTTMITDAPLGLTVGRGTGCDDSMLEHKLKTLARALTRHGRPDDPAVILQVAGGFEIAMATGGMLEAAARRMVILVDGYIMSAAALVASALEPAVTEAMIFCHRSASPGHQVILDHMQVRPLLDLGMRLGEGTGAAVALPLIRAAVDFLNGMASFAEAGVSTAEP